MTPARAAQTVEVFTDGACLGNPGPGGWAALLRMGTREKELSGGEADTTNNRMELMAAIAGIEALKRACTVVFTTDSEYVRRGVEEWLKRWHPVRMSYEAFTNANPFMPALEKAAESVREQRKPAASDNPFIVAQEKVSEQIAKSLDSWRETQEKLSEQIFLAVYGSPALQAAVGVNPEAARPRRPGRSLMHRADFRPQARPARFCPLSGKKTGSRARGHHAIAVAGVAAGR